MSVLVASHNEDTVRFTIEQMLQAGIDPEAGVVSFGQLFGMCDYITFPLGQSGFSVYKYIPYGPVNEVTNCGVEDLWLSEVKDTHLKEIYEGVVEILWRFRIVF